MIPVTDDREELAEERTHFAEDRTIMAMERTFAGWIRTAFAAIGIGLAFHVVFDEFEPPWLARAIATMFILAGGWVAIAAERRIKGWSRAKNMALAHGDHERLVQLSRRRSGNPKSTPQFSKRQLAHSFQSVVLRHPEAAAQRPTKDDE